MKNLPVALCCLLLVVPLRLGECWAAPWFCHQLECPVYTVVNKTENFEERSYSSSRWITTDVPSSTYDDISDGLMKLYRFMQGDNSEKRAVPLTRPGLVTVTEAGKNGQQVSTSFYITPDTVLPKPNDETIREEMRPSCTVYVRVFTTMPSEAAAMENKEKLMEDLQAAGKHFDSSRYEGAGYDSPFTLFNRHNEVWIYAL